MDSTRIVHTDKKKFTRRLKQFFTQANGEKIAQRHDLNVAQLLVNYEERFARYMRETDFGPNDVNRGSYLNVFTSLTAYELMREAGLSEEEAFAAYNYTCAPTRKLTHTTYGLIDAMPSGFDRIREDIISDLTGPKRVSWSAALLQNDHEAFEYKITRCFYFEVCTEHGYPEFTKAFCDHDLAAYGDLWRNVRFQRFSSFGHGGDCCHDRFECVRPKYTSVK